MERWEGRKNRHDGFECHWGKAEAEITSSRLCSPCVKYNPKNTKSGIRWFLGRSTFSTIVEDVGTPAHPKTQNVCWSEKSKINHGRLSDRIIIETRATSHWKKKEKKKDIPLPKKEVKAGGRWKDVPTREKTSQDTTNQISGAWLKNIFIFSPGTTWVVCHPSFFVRIMYARPRLALHASFFNNTHAPHTNASMRQPAP